MADMASDANTPCTYEQLVMLAYNLMFFHWAVQRQFQAMESPNDKKLDFEFFQYFFTIVHQQLRKTKQTTRTENFHSSKNEADDIINFETTKEIANLSVAVTSD